MKKINYTMFAGFADAILKEGIEKACESAARLGYSSVEAFASVVSNGRNAIPDQKTARQAREILSRSNLTAACHSVYADFWNCKDTEKALMKEVEIAYEIGSPYLHHTLLPGKIDLPDSPGYEEALKVAVEGATHVADYAKTLGIKCLYEDQGRYVNGVKGFGGFYQEMKKRCENIGICADFGNILFVNEKPEDFLPIYMQDVCHVHVKDYLWKQAKETPGRYWLKAAQDSWLRDTMVGSGVVDIETCIKILKDNDYQGAIALENGHPEPFEEGVMQAMEYINRIYGVK